MNHRSAGTPLRMAAHVCLFVLGCVGVAIAADEPPSPQREEAFLQALVGAWRGQAVRTPRGPLPYDITFRRQPNGEVAGVANPGEALHHWAFYAQDGRLRLRFLTTFRGNTEPTWLAAEQQAPGFAQFRAEQPPYLTVEVTTSSDAVEINVLLHGEAHVDIRLRRRT